MTSLVSSTPLPGSRNEFAELSRQVRGAGLLEPRRGYYITRIVLNLLALVGVGIVFVQLGDSWWQLFTAILLAVVYTQLAFIGHDAGHRQIFRRHRANDVVGFLHGALVGISFGWWVGKHNRHHANPNHEDDDPDMDIPLLAFTQGQSHTRDGALRWMAKYQAFLFLPLLLLEGLNLHYNSFQAVLQRGGLRNLRATELTLLLAHVLVYLTLVLLVLSPGKAAVFIAVHHAAWGVYMGCSFAPNHKGMPTLSDGVKLDFLRRQVLTSRNVAGGRWVDFLLGGLNYQIEHHLFPRMPRPNLRRAQPLVHGFCVERGISYSQCGLVRSYGHVLGYLHELGAPLRAQAR